MKKSLGIGVVTAITGIIIGLAVNDWSITIKVCGYLGIGCLVLVGVFNGAFINGDRYRGNYANETKETRHEKEKITNTLLLVAVPNIIAAILIFIVN